MLSRQRMRHVMGQRRPRPGADSPAPWRLPYLQRGALAVRRAWSRYATTTSATAAAGRLLERIRVVRDVPRLDLGEEVVESPEVHR